MNNKKKSASDKPVEPTEEWNPILVDPESRAAMATLILKGYTRVQVIEAFDGLTVAIPQRAK